MTRHLIKTYLDLLSHNILYVVSMRRSMNMLSLMLLVLQSLLCVNELLAADGIVSNVRIGASELSTTRVVLNLNKKLPFKTFPLRNPNRFVIDLPEVGWQLPARPLPKKSGVFLRLRYGLNKPGNSRIVLDLSRPAILKEAFFLPDHVNKSVRLVIDLIAENESRKFANNPISKARGSEGKSTKKSLEFTERGFVQNPNSAAPQSGSIDFDWKNQDANKTSNFKLTPRKPLQYFNKNKKIVVLDAGHGGVDPGTIGRSGIYEKQITLAMAHELAVALENTGRYKAVLTRSVDKFIGLRDRVKISRDHQADIFISLHADSIKNKRISGPSLYTLSEKASDKEAAQLVEQDNKSNLIIGFDLSRYDADMKNIFIDLTRRESMNQSAKLATDLIKGLKREVKVLRNTHRFAGFAVLKAVDVPSVLIEMGFLSNSLDEKLLRSRKYRKKLAKSIVWGINQYFRRAEEVANY